MNKLTMTLATLTSTVLLATGAPAIASHGGDGRVVTTGSCSDGARWKLKAKPDDAGLEVEAEVDSDRSGQSWTWKIKDDGAVAAKGSATTRGPSGSFSVERRIDDKAGADTIAFRAEHAGEVCKGSLSI